MFLGIPTAVNHAGAQPSRLTQLSSGLTVKRESAGSNPLRGKLITASLVASDHGYTKEDAIRKQWNKQGSFNLYEVMNGGTVNLQDPNPGAEVLREFEKQLQANGIQKEVDWGRLGFDLRGIGFDAGDPAYAVGADDLSRKVDYLASRYVAAEDKIKSTTTGDAQAEQLNQLKELYQSALKEIAEGYSGIVGSFLEENGVSGEREKIYSSIVSGVGSKVEAYRKALSENAALDSLRGTEDQWLLDDDAYVASVLRESAGASAAAQTADAPYTLSDLEVLGQYASALSAMEKPNNANTYTLDKARIGLDFAMLAMKTDTLRHSGRVGSAMSDLLQKTMDGFTQSFLDRLDGQLSAQRSAGLAPGDKTGFAALDRSVIWDVYNETMRQYRSGADAMQALIKGAEYGAAKASAQSASGIYRYRNNAAYWRDFFEKSAEPGRLGAYESSGSTLQKYMAGWVDFLHSIGGGDSVRMNFILRSADQYMKAEGGLISANS